MSEYVLVKRELLERILCYGWLLEGGTQNGIDLRLLDREELRAVLAQEAGKCEPVYQVRSHGSDCWEDIEGESLEMCRCQPEEYEIRTLYTSPPAPVSVLLPSSSELRALVTEAARDSDLIAGANYYTAAELAANYMLSKIKELNQ